MMGEEPITNGVGNARVEEVEEPYKDEFDMGSDDGSSSSSDSVPSKYTYYSPLPRTAQSGFVVKLDAQHSIDSIPPVKSIPRTSEPYGTEEPPPLSPIEELEDDLLHQPKPRPRSVEAASIASVREECREGVSLEQQSELLFSRQHLELILADPQLSSRFSGFLRTYRPDSVPMLVYLLDTVKALKAIKYAEAIIGGLEPVAGYDFTKEVTGATMSWVIDDKAQRALDILAKDDLPAFIAYVYVRTVDMELVNRVTRRENHDPRHIADGLAEVFVLSDPAQEDNPIVFASEEFHEMTQYPRSYALGRNCRFLGGPRTDLSGITRFRASLDAEREHCEVLLNYRRDGTPFINLIMCVPLRDQYGRVRYFLGAQLDITELVRNCTELESLRNLVEQRRRKLEKSEGGTTTPEIPQTDAFEQLGETFNSRELEVLLKLKLRLNPDLAKKKGTEEDFKAERLPASPTKKSPTNLNNIFQLNGQGSAPPLGFYQNYLLVRPHPSLRILFASPDLRVAGILQAPLMSQLGGSQRVREELEQALEVGRKVTAKVQWISKTAQSAPSKWIHCTPLLGINGLIAVWMVILVDDVQAEEKQRAPVPVERNLPNELGARTAEALPWVTEGAPGLSGTIGNSFREGSGSSNASQAAPSNDGSRNSNDPLPPIPERNRLRKGIPTSMRRPSDGAKNATVTPFATKLDPRYKVKVWSGAEGDKQEQSMEENARPKPWQPRFGQPPDIVGSTVRPGPRINGRAYSFNSNSEHGISADDEQANGSVGSDRPTSRSSSNAPLSTTGQPVGLPIHTPGSATTKLQNGAETRPFTRKTYKSLSPYGVLFDE